MSVSWRQAACFSLSAVLQAISLSSRLLTDLSGPAPHFLAMASDKARCHDRSFMVSGATEKDLSALILHWWALVQSKGGVPSGIFAVISALPSADTSWCSCVVVQPFEMGHGHLQPGLGCPVWLAHSWALAQPGASPTCLERSITFFKRTLCIFSWHAGSWRGTQCLLPLLPGSQTRKHLLPSIFPLHKVSLLSCVQWAQVLDWWSNSPTLRSQLLIIITFQNIPRTESCLCQGHPN